MNVTHWKLIRLEHYQDKSAESKQTNCTQGKNISSSVHTYVVFDCWREGLGWGWKCQTGKRTDKQTDNNKDRYLYVHRVGFIISATLCSMRSLLLNKVIVLRAMSVWHSCILIFHTFCSVYSYRQLFYHNILANLILNLCPISQRAT